MAHDQALQVQVGDRGRLVLPAEIRERLNLHRGDRLLLTVESDGRLCLANVRQGIRATRGLYRARARHRSLVDELIAERRTA